MVTITSSPLIPGEIIGKVDDSTAGALNIFIGTIRDTAPDGREVIKLEYEAYEPMAVREIQKIVDTAIKRFGVIGWEVAHRVGTLMPGDVAVVIAISTSHRKEAFQACQFVIDELKRTVPIWKKEFLEDGEVWVSAHP